MNTDLIRFIDSISRDKNIDKESVFSDLEAAMVSAVHKAYEEAEDVSVVIDRVNGTIQATVDDEPIDMRTLGRIAAQTAKQVMIQRIREDERNSIFEEYSQRVGTVVTGTVTRYEGGTLTVNLGRAEAFLPKSEQIPGEAHQPGERVRAMILDVREEQNQVRIVLTQTHPDYIRKLFELEVPEVGERIIEIRALAREAGYRTKVAVSSIDAKVDAVGACVGVRGSRIRNIVDELGGEKIDIVRWNESSQVLITNALKPAEVKEVFLCFELGRATVIVDEDQLSLAIGKRGQNVRLGARLTGWDIDISTPAEYDKNVDDMEAALKGIEGVEDVLLDKMLAMGIVSLTDLTEVGTEPFVSELGMAEELAAKVVQTATREAQRIAAEAVAAKADKPAVEAGLESEEAAEPAAPEAEEAKEGGASMVVGDAAAACPAAGETEAEEAGASALNGITEDHSVSEQDVVSGETAGADRGSSLMAEDDRNGAPAVATDMPEASGDDPPVEAAERESTMEAGAVESGDPT